MTPTLCPAPDVQPQNPRGAAMNSAMRAAMPFLRITALSTVLLLGPLGLSAAGNSLVWRGSVQTDHRLLLEDERDWAWNENRLDLTMEKRGSQLRVLSNVWLRHLEPSAVTSSDDLFSKDRISPWNLDVRELHVEVYGFLSDKLDLKVGRQRIAWGTADRFNPTDNLNPPDLEDLLDFGRAHGSDALNLHWHIDHRHAAQLVFMPRFQPANLPLSPFAGLFGTDAGWTSPHGDMPIPVASTHIDLPRNNLREGSTLGMRWTTYGRRADISLSYVYGRAFLPLPVRIEIELDETGAGMQSRAHLQYPRHHVIGADLAGSIGRVGAWAEAGVFIPESAVHTLITADALGWHEQITALEKEPYVKFVLGGDYTFSGGTYLNLQYLRGFLHESGRDELNDYLFVQVERDIRRFDLNLKPLAAGLTMGDRDDARNNYTWFYRPEVSYQGIDNLDITLGAFLAQGKGEHLLAQLKDKNMLHLKVTAHF